MHAHLKALLMPTITACKYFKWVFFSLSLYSMPTFLCKWAINVTLACEKHLFFSTNSSKCREKGQWVKKWLHPIKAVAAELTNMRQHRASCANWRYAFCMQLWVTQMLFSREALLEKTFIVKNLWGGPFLDKDAKPFLIR